jgi:hypothetical protein
MVGACPRTTKGLKGGVCCINNTPKTCFCSAVGCACTDRKGTGECFDAQLEWCQKYDPHGKYNKWCKDGYFDFNSRTLPGPYGNAVENILPATDPAYKSNICNNNPCGFLDLACEGAKTQAGCGGSSSDFVWLALGGIAVLAVFMIVS